MESILFCDRVQICANCRKCQRPDKTMPCLTYTLSADLKHQMRLPTCGIWINNTCSWALRKENQSADNDYHLNVGSNSLIFDIAKAP